MTGHERIQRLRNQLGIPEERTTKDEDDYERRYRKARAKRVEEAGYIDRYVELYNRDYWTDEWLGPGPDPGLPYMEDAPKSAKVSDQELERREWTKNYVPKKVPNLQFSAKEPKAVRKARKKRKQAEITAARQADYDLAYWFLECYLKRKYADQLYDQYANDVEGLVDYVSSYARSWFAYVNRDTRPLTAEEVMADRADPDEEVVDIGGMKFHKLERAERKRRHYITNIREDRCPDIPDEYWDEFEEWCKDHPLKKYRKKAKALGLGSHTGAMDLRRIQFLKKINKRNRGFHKSIMKSGLNMFDPVTGQSFVSEKKMKSYMEKRMKRYDRKRAEFVTLLDGMVKSGEISEDMAIGWMGDSDEARQRVKARYKDLKSRVKDTKSKYGPDHTKKYMKQRDAWFKKFGADPDAPPFTVTFDGEETEIRNIAKKGHPPIWRCDRPERGVTDYIEL